MPHRDDYEREWNNDAEELLTPLLPQTDDDHLDRDVKLAHVDMYLRTVAERRRRKALVRDYDLVSTFFKLEKPGLASRAWQYAPSAYAVMKRENELRDELRRFSLLLPADQMKVLVTSLSKQELLMERIVELQKLRKNGITSLPGRWKYDTETPALQRKRRPKKSVGGNDQKRKAHNRWNRFRRWQKRLYEIGESDG